VGRARELLAFHLDEESGITDNACIAFVAVNQRVAVDVIGIRSGIKGAVDAAHGGFFAPSMVCQLKLASCSCFDSFENAYQQRTLLTYAD